MRAHPTSAPGDRGDLTLYRRLRQGVLPVLPPLCRFHFLRFFFVLRSVHGCLPLDGRVARRLKAGARVSVRRATSRLTLRVRRTALEGHAGPRRKKWCERTERAAICGTAFEPSWLSSADGLASPRRARSSLPDGVLLASRSRAHRGKSALRLRYTADLLDVLRRTCVGDDFFALGSRR